MSSAEQIGDALHDDDERYVDLAPATKAGTASGKGRSRFRRPPVGWYAASPGPRLRIAIWSSHDERQHVLRAWLSPDNSEPACVTDAAQIVTDDHGDTFRATTRSGRRYPGYLGDSQWVT